MNSKPSRMAGAIAAAAALSMVATPALARGGSWGGWGKRYHHRHHDRIDTGDVLAGILILGGIAAVASAAGKSARDGREREGDYPQPERRDAPRYGEPRERGEPGAGGMGMAVDACASEVERTDRAIEAITSVEREGEGWRVEGRVGDGRPFACSVAEGGRIRSVTVDGGAAWSDDERARDYDG